MGILTQNTLSHTFVSHSIYIYIYLFIYICVRVHVRFCMCVGVCECVCAWCVCVCMCVFVCGFVLAYACVRVCVRAYSQHHLSVSLIILCRIRGAIFRDAAESVEQTLVKSRLDRK